MQKKKKKKKKLKKDFKTTRIYTKNTSKIKLNYTQGTLPKHYITLKIITGKQQKIQIYAKKYEYQSFQSLCIKTSISLRY